MVISARTPPSRSTRAQLSRWRPTAHPLRITHHAHPTPLEVQIAANSSKFSSPSLRTPRFFWFRACLVRTALQTPGTTRKPRLQRAAPPRPRPVTLCVLTHDFHLHPVQETGMRRRPVLLAPTGADGRTPAARESCGLATPSPQGMLSQARARHNEADEHTQSHPPRLVRRTDRPGQILDECLGHRRAGTGTSATPGAPPNRHRPCHLVALRSRRLPHRPAEAPPHLGLDRAAALVQESRPS